MATVLIYSLMFPPDGVSTAYIMGDLAMDLARRGHQVSVLTTTPHYNREPSSAERQPLARKWGGLVYRSALGPVEVWHLPMPMKRAKVLRRAFDFIGFHLLSLAVGLFAIGRFDVVFSPSPPLTMGLIGWILARRSGGKAIYNVQEVYPDFAVNQGLITNRGVIRALEVLERMVYRLNDCVTTISDGLARTIAPRVPESRLLVIPNFIDTEKHGPQPRHNEFSHRHGLDDGFVVLYAGNIGLSQDWDGLLDAAAYLAAEGVRFVVVGNGVMSATLRRSVDERRLINVELLEYQRKEVVPLIYGSCDLGIIPMKRAASLDTFPSKLLTIMASERPVLVAAERESDLARMVDTSRCGWVIAPGDTDGLTQTIRAIKADENERARRSAAGLEHVRKYYSLEAVGERYSQLIHSLTTE